MRLERKWLDTSHASAVIRVCGHIERCGKPTPSDMREAAAAKHLSSQERDFAFKQNALLKEKYKCTPLVSTLHASTLIPVSVLATIKMRLIPNRILLLLTFLLNSSLAAQEVEEEPPIPSSDLLDSIASTSFAQHHAGTVISTFSLPPTVFTRITPPDENLELRSLVHLNTPSSRYLTLCKPKSSDEQCLMISPYVLKTYDRTGAQEKQEKTLMMLLAEKGALVESVGILHMEEGGEGDRMGIWDWVKRKAKDTRESLVRKYGGELFRFPDLEPPEDR